MNKKQSQVTTFLLPDAGKEFSNNINILKKYLYHWPLFLLFVLFSFVAAYYYLQIANPIFPITATLKFKTPTSASGTPLTIKDGSLNQLDPVSTPIIVENEINVMQSKKLMYQIVKDLQLWVNISQKKGLKILDLYSNSPIRFNFIDTNFYIPTTGEKLEITLQDTNTFFMKDSIGVKKVFKFSSILKSPFGSWKLEPTKFLENFIGSTIIIKVSEPDMVSDEYQKNIKVALENKDAPFVNLSMTDKIPQRGKDILNSLITLYRQNAQAEKNEQTQKILSFVNGRVDSLKQELDDQEKLLEKYKQVHNITDLTSQATSFRSIKDENSQAINNINIQLSTLATLDRYANSSSLSESLPAGSDNLSDHSLVALYDKLAALQIEKEKKLAITPAANPLFVALDRQIAALKNDFREKIQTIRAALIANKQQLLSYGSGVKSSLNKIPTEEKQYNDLVRDQQSKEDIYKFLSSKREEIGLHYASIIQDSEIVDDAHSGAIKWPKVPIVYGLAIILGVVLAIGFLSIRENFNDRISTRKQIENETGAPILGELSYLDSNELIVVSAGRSKFAIGEQFRVLRTNLYHLHSNTESGRVTLFTSSISGEGKSFVSSNLAVTLAYASRKTIILEMDLRNPKVSTNFGLSADYPGISDYLSGASSDLERMIRPSGIAELDVLSCGAILPNPSELLGNEKLDELIAKLKAKYDDIIIDSPPIHLVTDALLIARVADASLFMIRQNFTYKNELEFINEIYTNNRFKKFCIVFNGIKREASIYGYGNGYHNYSQYNSYTEKKKRTIKTYINSFFRRF